MLNILFTILILTQLSLIISSQSGSSKNQPDQGKLAKENFIKNLYKANSLNDLSKLGVQIIKKPQSLLGRSNQLQDLKEATPGKCDPKPVCITNPLVANLTSNQMPFPQCINIHRCDGCCPPNEKCVAIETKTVFFKNVGTIQFDATMTRYSDGVVSVQNHTECECQCLWQTDDDCKLVNQNFIKNPDYCECMCPEELGCPSSMHKFDRDSCSCKCRREIFGRMELACKNKGLIWDDHDCKCHQIRVSMATRQININ